MIEIIKKNLIKLKIIFVKKKILTPAINIFSLFNLNGKILIFEINNISSNLIEVIL